MSMVEKKPMVGELGNFMEKLKGQMALALPKHMNSDRMTRLALTEFSKNPALQKCSFASIASCVMTASQLGLEIGVGGQAYIIPYKDTATFVPGWKGLIDLVNRAGRASAWTGAVFAGDDFDWGLGDAPFIRHKPMGENDPAKLLFAYAVGRVNGSDWPVIECWPNERIKKHFKKFNKVGDRHYANQNWEMYARKVVLLQVLKYLPQSVELNAAIDIANGSVEGRRVTIDANFVAIEETPVEPTSGPESGRSVDDLVKPKNQAAFNVADFESKLAACKTTGEINAVFKAIDREKLSESDQERIDVLGLEREREIGAIQD
jgi:recombination protein RecT